MKPLDRAPPLMVVVEMVNEASDGGSTVTWPEAEAEFNVAVRVTGVADVT